MWVVFRGFLVGWLGVCVVWGGLHQPNPLFFFFPGSPTPPPVPVRFPRPLGIGNSCLPPPSPFSNDSSPSDKFSVFYKMVFFFRLPLS